MVSIYDNTKIYVACPPFAQTGGPEALHALAFEMRNLGMDAYMFYVGATYSENLTAPAYRRFNLPYVCTIEENSENVIIVPEIWGHLLQQYKNMQRVFFWLSVDNYFGRALVDFKDDTITHLVQSYYAEDFVKKNNAKNVSYVSDYLNDYYTKDIAEIYKDRKNIILYNPSKGMEFTANIINQAPHLKFVPIRGMGQEQIKEIALTSKMYIDFGHHPGKDRLPRETAILGNLVVTNKRGSAGFYKDVPIGDEYKFDDEISNIPEIIKKIEYFLDNYENCIEDFVEYRKMILDERKNFIEDIKRTFVKV